jgi:hypothetical protein
MPRGGDGFAPGRALGLISFCQKACQWRQLIRKEELAYQLTELTPFMPNLISLLTDSVFAISLSQAN